MKRFVFMSDFQDACLDWSNEVGLHESTNVEKQCLKLAAECGEACDAFLKGERGSGILELGDCMVVIANICNKLGVEMESVCGSAYDKINGRVGKGSIVNGTFVKE